MTQPHEAVEYFRRENMPVITKGRPPKWQELIKGLKADTAARVQCNDARHMDNTRRAIKDAAAVLGVAVEVHEDSAYFAVWVALRPEPAP